MSEPLTVCGVVVPRIGDKPESWAGEVRGFYVSAWAGWERGFGVIYARIRERPMDEPVQLFNEGSLALAGAALTKWINEHVGVTDEGLVPGKADMKTKTAAPQVEFRTLIVDAIDESATNPRRTFSDSDLDELANSIHEIGLQQPVKVRPRGDRFEIVFGARRFRAVKSLGLVEIPALIQDMTDEQVLEAQLVENLQRADVHQIEEAEGYERLMALRGLTVMQVAVKIGKSKEYVYARLKLLALCKAARDAFFRGEINASVALLIARIPEEKDQEEALEEIAGMSFREAATFVRQKFMLDLETAPFDVKDKTLVADAGACGPCPFRTGNEPSLFSEIESGGVCTKVKCFRAKCDATWERRAAEAASAGLHIVDSASARGLVPMGNMQRHGSPYVRADTLAYGVGDLNGKPWSEVLKRKLPKPVAVARDAVSGGPIELLSIQQCNEAAVALGLVPKAVMDRAYDESPEARAAREKEYETQRRKDELDRVVAEKSVVDLVKRVRSKGFRDELLRELIAIELDEASPELDEVLGFLGEEYSPDAEFEHLHIQLTDLVKKSKGNDLAAIYVACRVGTAYRAPEMADVMKAYRVDLKALRAKAAAERKAREKADKAKAASHTEAEPETEEAAADETVLA